MVPAKVAVAEPVVVAATGAVALVVAVTVPLAMALVMALVAASSVTIVRAPAVAPSLPVQAQANSAQLSSRASSRLKLPRVRVVARAALRPEADPFALAR